MLLNLRTLGWLLMSAGSLYAIKNAFAIINMTYRCHVMFGMIQAESEKHEDRQTDRYFVRTAAGGEDDGT